MRRLQHEVRTPVGQIMGYSELLEEELVERGQQDLAPDLQKIRAAAQHLLDLLDGKLRSEAPAAAAESAATPPREEAGAEPASAAVGERARLLVVDDDANNRDLLVRRLAQQGFEVETAPDGIEALRKLETREFDLVMLDVMMPGMSGLEVLERVRRERSMSELPVILASALSESSDAVEGLARGANDYVTKPFDFPVVIARVRTQLAAHGSARQAAALARQLEFRNTFIRQAFGRDLSDDLLVELAETPGALELGGEARRVAALVADLRGGRALGASLAPAQWSALLKNVIDGLAEVVAHYEGTVDAFAGDSLVALFGLPGSREGDAERAVACGVALQLEMEAINERNRAGGLPAVAIGVGVATGDVVVVGFGSGDALRYKAIGEPLARAARVEALAAAGEVWICPQTHAALGDLVQADRERDAELPGADAPVRLRRVLGVGGTHLISLRALPGG
jgi:CheY-like chemotaxis protein